MFGNVKPVTEKSDAYRVLDLAEQSTEWEKVTANPDGENIANDMESENKNEEENQLDRTDLAFQSKKTASIVSLNSACRGRIRLQGRSLKEFTNSLLLGVNPVISRTEKRTMVAGVAALETTVKGKMNQEEIMLRTVVLRHEDCVFDLMFVSRPDHFEADLPVFSRFVNSFQWD